MAREPSAITILNSFKRKAQRAESLTNEGLRLFRRNQLSQASLDALFTSSFLSLHSHFEIFLEDLFFSTVTGSSGIADCEPQVIFESREQAQQIFLATQSYINWMPYEKGAQKFTRRAYKSGSPFARLRRQPDEQSVLKEISSLRNAIAHQSRHSLREVEHLTKPMRPRRRNVAGYLQNRVQGSTQFSLHATSIRRVASALAASDVKTAKTIWLSPETGYKATDAPGSGRFLCVGCGNTKTIRSNTEKLKRCTRCNARRRLQLGWRRDYP
jgi:hypothetical protein